LDATRDGLRKLVAAKANLQAVEEEMTKVEKLCQDPGNEVKAFKKISRVSTQLNVLALRSEGRREGETGRRKR